jgi:hypothetical protein
MLNDLGQNARMTIDCNLYRELLAELGFSQVEAARIFEVDERTSRRWASGELPFPVAVAMLLSLMTEYPRELTPDYVRSLVGLPPHKRGRTAREIISA